MNDNNQLILIDEKTLKDKIYTIRGQQVMLDSDLAEIYGYSTKAFNQQVKNNSEKFDEDFRFQLTKDEIESLSRSNNLTSIQLKGVKGGRSYLPYAFTEQGIYMLMTVLKGELAVQQSKTLIRLFKKMKDYFVETSVPSSDHYVQLLEATSLQSQAIAKNTAAIARIESSMITKDALSPFLQLFEKDRKQEEILILNGEPYKADLAYQKILSEVKKELIMVDDYLSSKTLKHLLHCPSGVMITLISDNKGRSPLQLYEYTDFLKEYPALSGRITLLRSHNKVYDRYIFLDPADPDGKIYHCGASSKDAGEKITMIMECKDTSHFPAVLGKLLKGKTLVLT